MRLAIDVVGSYGRGVLRGVMAWAKTHDWQVGVRPGWSDHQPPAPEDWDADGLITQAATLGFDRRIARECKSRGVAVTNVSNIFGDSSLTSVLPDDAAVGRAAFEYLAGRGFRRFGFYGYRTPASFSARRRDAFAEAVRRAGGDWFEFDAGPNDAAGLRQWVRDLPEPAGVLCCNDRAAYDLLGECERAGVPVPTAVAVLGVDDDELTNTLVTPSLSSVTIPAVRIGFEAARLLDELMAGRSVSDGPLLLPPGAVVTRQSTDITAVEDRDVAAALTFIRAHVAEAFGVGDVADAVASSRRSLERRFRAALGLTVLDEVRRLRVERAKELLATTELAMPEIARASGFGDATRLGIVFRQLAGQPPTEYRRRVRPTAG